MTQAIAMNEMLERRGHRVVAVLVGQNQNRSLPAFFEHAFSVLVGQIPSPGFAIKQNRSIDLRGTVSNLLRHLPEYRRSLATLHETIQKTKPDLIVNFLEPLMGVYNLRRRHSIPVIAVGHQFMLEHPEFLRVKGFTSQKLAMRRYVALTGVRSARLALSFYSTPDIPERRFFVSPPILRRQLFELKPDSVGRYLLVYLLNHGYAEEIVRWHEQHPEIPIHCFYDKPGAPMEEKYDDSLTFHKIHGERFLSLMASCRGVACTAGFESVSEAAYLGKPLLLVPVENHFEQYVNACDAEQTGIGLRDTSFQLSRLLNADNRQASLKFRQWVDQAEAIAMRAIEAVAGSATQSKQG
jgi:uncharacterized protein (TIGR00661 family)